MERKKRVPGKERQIAEITGEDYRVRVLGTIIDIDEANSSALLDDGTGRATILFADPDQFEAAKEGKLVRIIGKARREGEVEIEVEIIQDMRKLDLGLYEQVRYIEEKLSREV
jgi:hypothetical protein